MYIQYVLNVHTHACSGDIRGMMVISSRKTLASLMGTGLFGALLVQLYSILNRQISLRFGRQYIFIHRLRNCRGGKGMTRFPGVVWYNPQQPLHVCRYMLLIVQALSILPVFLVHIVVFRCVWCVLGRTTPLSWLLDHCSHSIQQKSLAKRPFSNRCDDFRPFSDVYIHVRVRKHVTALIDVKDWVIAVLYIRRMYMYYVHYECLCER